MGLAHDTDELRRVLRSCRKDVAERQNEQSYAAIGEVLLLWICNFSATGCASNDQGCLLLFWFFIELVVAIWKRCVEQELLVVGMHITLALQCLSCYFCRLPGVSWILLFVCTAIAQRALENLVHEHSHGNLLRPSNHWLARVTGFLVYKDLEEYRSSHRIHHQKFGLDEDPDRIVYGRAATRPLLGKVSVVCVWYHENLQKKGLWIQVATCLTVFMLRRLTWSGGEVLHWIAAALAWWTSSYILVLPFFRACAEHSEHSGLIKDPQSGEHLDDYLRKHWTMTRSNIGVFHHWVLHPMNDGYHTLHHLDPQIPFYMLRTLHEKLMRSNTFDYAETCTAKGLINKCPQVFY
ncbi:unnamed protein product [Durusdinium trenchii]|uniref:Fatty acid desaturase domain-containing protein n=1 Tax=Durusdinium trenchii TaxID=1381693 RepID=A0ABP0I5T2_9DINO